MIRVVHPGSGSWLFTHPGSRGQKGNGSRIWIRTLIKFRSRFRPRPFHKWGIGFVWNRHSVKWNGHKICCLFKTPSVSESYRAYHKHFSIVHKMRTYTKWSAEKEKGKSLTAPQTAQYQIQEIFSHLLTFTKNLPKTIKLPWPSSFRDMGPQNLRPRGQHQNLNGPKFCVFVFEYEKNILRGISTIPMRIQNDEFFANLSEPWGLAQFGIVPCVLCT